MIDKFMSKDLHMQTPQRSHTSLCLFLYYHKGWGQFSLSRQHFTLSQYFEFGYVCVFCPCDTRKAFGF